MLRFWTRIVHWHEQHRPHEPEWLDLLEILMASVTDLDTKLDAIKVGVDALKQQIADLKTQPLPVATQADLDALAAKADAIQAAING